VREAFGDDLVILSDANTGYSVADARAVDAGHGRARRGLARGALPAHDYRSYRMAAGFGRTPLAAGENHYTRFEFQPRDRGRRDHDPAAGPVEDRRAHPRRCALPRWPRRTSSPSIRTAR